jgi:hypothetical protein
MLARRTLRASFVVTVASGALVGLGCSSTVTPTPDGQVQGDANPPSDVLQIDISNPPLGVDVPDAAIASCPAATPMSGSACDPSLSRTCSYGDCLGRPTIEARCAGGVWQVLESSCNPPPPDAGPPPEVCPATAPTPDSPCTYTGPGCTYGMCPPSSTTFAMCVSGRWSVGIATCNPPIDAGPPPDA